ncbi:MAG: hypothetical protein QOJ20_749 [Mycobacterium sp.]|jgi:hypothetical protein|nr:hypothetical protein [Mycobacterium sp.]MDT5279554.1 hypothetical protein [Mycobacterium sp.]
MTLQSGNLRRAVKGAVASSALAVGLLMGIGSTTANADVLDDVGVKYMQGAGGGQVSNFVKEALTLRALGFKPSKSNLEELHAGWDYLPNQTRLIDALKNTVAFQRKLQAIQQNANNPSQPGFNMGQTPLPPGIPPDPGNPNNTGIGLIPGTGITQPIG